MSISTAPTGLAGVDPGTVSVTGTGRATAAPDVMRAAMTATAMRPSLAEALAAAEAAAARIRAALTDAGVAAVDAATAGLSVNAEQVWNENTGPRITGYRAEHEIALTLRDLDSAGRMLGQALAAGGDDVRLGGVSFAIEDEGPLRVQARELAWHDASARARQLAQLAGRPLGAVKQVNEQAVGMPGPMPMVRMAMAAGAADVAVQPGSVGIEISLGVQWSLL
jgi:uncharacterized protein